MRKTIGIYVFSLFLAECNRAGEAGELGCLLGYQRVIPGWSLAGSHSQRLRYSQSALKWEIRSAQSYFPPIAFSTSSAVDGSAPLRLISLPSLSTQKSSSMRTPRLSSGI